MDRYQYWSIHFHRFHFLIIILVDYFLLYHYLYLNLGSFSYHTHRNYWFLYWGELADKYWLKKSSVLTTLLGKLDFFFFTWVIWSRDWVECHLIANDWRVVRGADSSLLFFNLNCKKKSLLHNWLGIWLKVSKAENLIV